MNVGKSELLMYTPDVAAQSLSARLTGLGDFLCHTRLTNNDLTVHETHFRIVVC